MIDVFAEKYGAKYGKVVECLTKDRDALLAACNFPAEHRETGVKQKQRILREAADVDRVTLTRLARSNPNHARSASIR